MSPPRRSIHIHTLSHDAVEIALDGTIRRERLTRPDFPFVASDFGAPTLDVDSAAAFLRGVQLAGLHAADPGYFDDDTAVYAAGDGSHYAAGIEVADVG